MNKYEKEGSCIPTNSAQDKECPMGLCPPMCEGSIRRIAKEEVYRILTKVCYVNDDEVVKSAIQDGLKEDGTMREIWNELFLRTLQKEPVMDFLRRIHQSRKKKDVVESVRIIVNTCDVFSISNPFLNRDFIALVCKLSQIGTSTETVTSVLRSCQNIHKSKKAQNDKKTNGF